MISRRYALKMMALTTAACATGVRGALAQGLVLTTNTGTAGPFKLPDLPYPYDALEPYIDAKTMEIHHDRHHQAYVTNLNKAIADAPELRGKSIEDLLKDLSAIPEKVRTTVRNSGGGHYNHMLFWQMMKKGGGGEPGGELAKAIDKSFGSFSGFKDKLTETATKVFGSGWAWLALDDSHQLRIEPTPNQDTPITGAWFKNGKAMKPLLGIDVWEHAYYLKYQYRRPDYIKAWFNVVNWDYVSDQYRKGTA